MAARNKKRGKLSRKYVVSGESGSCSSRLRGARESWENGKTHPAEEIRRDGIERERERREGRGGGEGETERPRASSSRASRKTEKLSDEN
jgi:hypothetical protein